MYLDQLDDIRSIPHTKNFERNCALAQASIMKNIIQGKRITLSETNIITSFPVLKMLEDDYFIKLFEENIINVAVWEKSLKRLQTDDFKEVIIDKLQQGLGDDEREPFYFPAIDIFDKDKLYSDNSIKNREEPRKIAIDIFRNNGLTHLDYPKTQKEYFEALRNFAIVLSKVSNPINRNKTCRSGISSKPLSQYLKEYINRANRPEWDTVGMLGKLYVRDNGTCEVNGYATVGENGIATASTEKTNMRVLSRVNENVVRVLLK